VVAKGLIMQVILGITSSMALFAEKNGNIIAEIVTEVHAIQS
jgi:hypothetical protein